MAAWLSEGYLETTRPRTEGTVGTPHSTSSGSPAHLGNADAEIVYLDTVAIVETEAVAGMEGREYSAVWCTDGGIEAPYIL